MQEKIKVAVDAMGGDNAPGEIVKGAVDAVNVRKDIQVLLVGKQDRVKEEKIYISQRPDRGCPCRGSD